MGFLSRKKRAVGLDIGQATMKAVAMVADRGTVRVLESHLFDGREEGLLGADELREDMPPWLQRIGLVGDELVIGVPQYMATTQISDFPEGSAGNLDSMVRYETQQLAGLSDEPFLHDYHVMTPCHGRRNPVLIGICRESVIAEQARSFDEYNLRVADFAMNGVAMANAYLHLCDDAPDLEAPQMLIDIGLESSTMVIMAGGQVIFMSTLLFGSLRLRRALEEELGISEEVAERRLRDARLDPNDAYSPLLGAARRLEGEIESVLEQWREQETSDIKSRMFCRVCVCGGGAHLLGLADFLGRTLGCEGLVLAAPTGGEDAQSDPSLTVAYGLALHGLGLAPISISLATSEVNWVAARRRSFGYLVAACATLLLLITTVLGRAYVKLVQDRDSLEKHLQMLTQCEAIIPRLEKVENDLASREKLVLPMVEKGNRARRFLGGLQQLALAHGENDWFVYVADRASYEAGKSLGLTEGEAATDEGRRGTRTGTPPSMPRLPGAEGPAPSAGSETENPYPNRVRVTDLQPMRALIAAGYVKPPADGDVSGLTQVTDITNKLNAGGDGALFRNVDKLRSSETAGREDIFRTWVPLLKELERRDASLRYPRFTLVMPFAEMTVARPQAEEGEAK